MHNLVAYVVWIRNPELTFTDPLVSTFGGICSLDSECGVEFDSENMIFWFPLLYWYVNTKSCVI